MKFLRASVSQKAAGFIEPIEPSIRTPGSSVIDNSFPGLVPLRISPGNLKQQRIILIKTRVLSLAVL